MRRTAPPSRALTTTNPAGGWRRIATGATRASAWATAEQILPSGLDSDVYEQTERRTLVVVSKTAATRYYDYDLDRRGMYGLDPDDD